MSNPFEPGTSGLRMSADASMLAVQYLNQTRPWLYFLAVLGFLASGLMVVAGLFFVVSMAATGSGELGALGPALGMIYVVMGGLYAVPAFLMLQQALAIGAVQTDGDQVTGLEDVLRHSRNFWRLVGGLTLALMVLYCGGILTMMVVMGSIGAAVGS
ncbi:MAG: hypothetical protein ABMB14_04375 [Myxococcota bacterium]